MLSCKFVGDLWSYKFLWKIPCSRTSASLLYPKQCHVNCDIQKAHMATYHACKGFLRMCGAFYRFLSLRTFVMFSLATLVIIGVVTLTTINPCFLSNTSSERSFLVLWCMQVDHTEVVTSLLNSQFIPVCLRIMETGNELSKTVCPIIFCKMSLSIASSCYNMLL